MDLNYYSMRIVDKFPKAMIVLKPNEELTFIYGNRMFYSIAGDYIGRKILGKFSNIFVAEKREIYKQLITKDLKKKGSVYETIEIENDEGDNLLITICGGISEDTLLYCTINEVHENVLNEYTFYRTISEMSDDLLFRYNMIEGQIKYIGETRKMFRLEEEESNYPKSIVEKGIVHRDDIKDFLRLVDNMKKGVEDQIKFRAVNVYDEIHWYKKEFKIYRNKKGEVVEAVGKIINIQEQVEAELKTKTDQLTGCMIKRQFEKEVMNAIKDEKKKIALAIIDLDDFKRINDTYGHQVGDETLKEVGKRIRNSFREDDLVGRIGGDEFMVMIKNGFGQGKLRKKFNILLEKINEPMKINDKTINVTCSIGVSKFPIDGRSFVSLYNNADVALYHAKRKMKNRCEIYNQMMEN